MDKIFLSYSFDQQDPHGRTVLSHLRTVLEAHGLGYRDGAALGGGPLTEAVKGRIADCSGLISVFTERGNPGEDGLFSPAEWVLAELQHASSIEKHCVGIYFPSVRPPGAMLAEHERIAYDPGNFGPALLQLMMIVSMWKESWGRPVTIRVEPVDLAQRLFSGKAGTRCEARLTYENGPADDWEPVRVAKRAGGALVTLRAPADRLIQLQAYVDGEHWMSEEVEQVVHVALEKTR